MQLFTIGFTRKSARQFFTTLADAGVRTVVDVRLNNNSQLAGFSKQDDLAWFLHKLSGIEYRHELALAPTREMLEEYRESKNGWKLYEERFLELLAERRIEKQLDRRLLQNACLLCSEDSPHHCHRRLVAEYLNRKWGGIVVKHLPY